MKRSGEADPRIQQVAALPWRRDCNGQIWVLLVTSRTNGKWMLPKGWPMAGLTDAQSAQQEALEEAGVAGKVSEAPIGSYRFIRLFDDGSTQPSQAIVYPLLVTDELAEWKERKQRQRRWVAADEAAQLVYEHDLRRFLTSLAAGRIVMGWQNS